MQQPLLNEKVLRDKRKKLRETFERIVRLYERENPETYKELRKLELDYETKRGQLALYFDSVKVGLTCRKRYYLSVSQHQKLLYIKHGTMISAACDEAIK